MVGSFKHVRRLLVRRFGLVEASAVSGRAPEATRCFRDASGMMERCQRHGNDVASGSKHATCKPQSATSWNRAALFLS